MNLLIDMDGVLCTEMPTFERALAQPLPGAKQALQSLRAAGHQIVIYSARSWSELALTKDWLDRHGMPYDGLHLGKPVADRIIDDRAIPFTGWPAALESLNRPAKPGVDGDYRRLLHTAGADFLRQIVARPGLRGPVLEVGRAGAAAEPGFDSRAALLARGLRHLTLDDDPGADLCCSLPAAGEHLAAGSLGAVILVDRLQHEARMFELPALLHRLLKPGGEVFCLTPWNLGLDGPGTDCWRISDAGYRALFAEGFEITGLLPIPCPGRALSPLGFQCVARRRT